MAARQLVAALAVAAAGLAAAQIEDEDTCTAAGADNFAARLAAGALYGECLPVAVVLVFDGSEYDGTLPDGTAAFPDRAGLVGEACVHPEHFTGSLTVGGTGCSSSNPAGCTAPTSNCPVGWNCNIVSDPDNAAHRGYGLQACRNGLYCHKGPISAVGDAGVCEECAGCTGASCGNCKTTFYPRVDQYSVMRLADSCAPQMDPAKGDAAAQCDAIMGCMMAGTPPKCVPGPTTGTTPTTVTDLKAPLCPDGCPDGHTIFRTPSAADKIVAQEFFVEMGLEGNGNAVVRSPIAVFSKDTTAEATAMYLKAGVLNGIPRKVSWEQTGLINTACPLKVTWPLSRSNVRENITATCFSIDGHCGVPGPIGGKWPMTDCGFGTYEGYYPADGKFAGMTWPDGTEGAPSDDCSQTFCAAEPPNPAEILASGVNPIQLYMTWAGTAADARDMSSGGLTYESFRQYSTFEGISKAKDAFTAVASKSRECVTNKHCGGD